MRWKRMPETVKLMLAAHYAARVKIGCVPPRADEKLQFYIRNHDVVQREFDPLIWSPSRILQLFV